MSRIRGIALQVISGLGLMLWQGTSLAIADTTVAISSGKDLASAIQTAKGGETLLLAGGDYGALEIGGFVGKGGTRLILRAADPANPPRFSAMTVSKTSHLMLDGLLFDYTKQPEDKANLRPFQLVGVDDVIVSNAVFDGDTDATGHPTAFGFSVRGSRGVVLEGSEIREFYRGLVISQSQDIVVRDNDVHAIRMDGMNFAEVKRVLIEGNHIHDFRRVADSKDHADMIQFWTNGTKTPSEHIVIRDNVLNSGHGLFTQSIFMRNDLVDRGLAGSEMFYKDVTIEENVIINAHLHGITVGETNGLMIRNNSVIRNAASEGKKKNPALWVPQIRVSSGGVDVTIARNVTGKVTGYDKQPDWMVEQNFLIQDRSPQESGFYDLVFRAARVGDPTDLANFAYLSGGPLDGAGLGASRLASGKN